MGVAGCGKSTVGREAAAQLNIPFLEGDDFHPASNVAKMSRGIALTDEDRMPWVDAMVKACWNTPDSRAIILACSALSKTVRDRLRIGLKNQCQFIHLHGDESMIEKRLKERSGHFFKADLLASQFAALDMPQGAMTLDIFQPVEVLTQKVCSIIQSENQA